MVCGNFILPESCKPCLFSRLFQFAQLILPYHTLGVVGVGDGGSPRHGGDQLIEPVVGVGHHGGIVDVQLGQQVAVSVVGVAAGGDGA